MVFSSLQFVLIFLPIFFFAYYIAPRGWKNAVLFFGSMTFYFVGTLDHPLHFALFILSILVDFTLGIAMQRYKRAKKALLILGVAYHVVCLCIFKYSGFVIGELGVDPPFDIILPIGISFYTFQGISYIADVYRGKAPAEESLLNYTVYLSMFEQLIAGPIVTYGHVRDDLQSRSIKARAVMQGLATFIFGLGMKVLLANPLGKLWGQVEAIGFESISTPLAWMAIAAYSFQIYFDFFGYSLMAVGLGRMLGFELPKNFDHPYTARTMTVFWRKWHMTLGSWFREYVYIPLGGNRCGRARNILNLLVVWMLTGLWHGAGYNFLVWGFALFVIILLEKLVIGKTLDSKPLLGHVYMVLIIPLTWVLFAIGDIGQIGVFFGRLFPFFGQGVWSIFRYDYLKYLREYYPFLIAGILFSTKLPYRILKKLRSRFVIGLLVLVIFLASLYCMYRGYDDPFLYFRF